MARSPADLSRRAVLRGAAGATGVVALSGVAAARKSNNVGYISEQDFDPGASFFTICGDADTQPFSPSCEGGRPQTYQGYEIVYGRTSACDDPDGVLFVDADRRVEPGEGYNWTRGNRACGDGFRKVTFVDVGPEGLNP